jgi:hypothetical protein
MDEIDKAMKPTKTNRRAVAYKLRQEVVDLVARLAKKGGITKTRVVEAAILDAAKGRV